MNEHRSSRRARSSKFLFELDFANVDDYVNVGRTWYVLISVNDKPTTENTKTTEETIELLRALRGLLC